MRRWLLGVFAMMLAALAVGPVRAQDNYPNRTITIVVGFAAGGTADIIARLIGQKLNEYTGANVVI